MFQNFERSFDSFYQILYIRGKHSIPYNQHFLKVSTQHIYSTPYVYSFEKKCPPNMVIPYPTSIRYSRVGKPSLYCSILHKSRNHYPTYPVRIAQILFGAYILQPRNELITKWRWLEEKRKWFYLPDLKEKQNFHFYNF